MVSFSPTQNCLQKRAAGDIELLGDEMGLIGVTSGPWVHPISSSHELSNTWLASGADTPTFFNC